MVTDKSVLFSVVPLDIIGLIQRQFTMPCMILQCRNRCGEEVTRYISLTVQDGCQDERERADSRLDHVYSATVNAGWPSTCGMSIAVPRNQQKSGTDQCTLIEIDYRTDMRGEPMMAHLNGFSARTMRGTCAWLGGQEWLVPCRGETYETYNNDSGHTHHTSLVSGSRTPGWGQLLLSASDYQMPGQVYFGTQSGALVGYSAIDDSVSEHGWGASEEKKQMTALHTLPCTGQLLVAHGSTVSLRDMRTQTTVGWSHKLPCNVWMTSAFVTETSVATWNDLIRSPDGHIYSRTFCKQFDLRMPIAVVDMPHWTLPTTVMPLSVARADQSSSTLWRVE